MSTTMTARLDAEVKERLDRLALSTRRQKSFLAAKAIRAFVGHNEWQIAETLAAVAGADAGQFANDAEVRALADMWKVNAGKEAVHSLARSRR